MGPETHGAAATKTLKKWNSGHVPRVRGVGRGLPPPQL